jgi:hypothetical protein
MPSKTQVPRFRLLKPHQIELLKRMIGRQDAEARAAARAAHCDVQAAFHEQYWSAADKIARGGKFTAASRAKLVAEVRAVIQVHKAALEAQEMRSKKRQECLMDDIAWLAGCMEDNLTRLCKIPEPGSKRRAPPLREREEGSALKRARTSGEDDEVENGDE